MEPGNSTWVNMLRVRAWYCIFDVATTAANASSLLLLRDKLIKALEATDEALKASGGHG